MAGVFGKMAKYLGAAADARLDSTADPQVLIAQAVEEAKRRHAAVRDQAAAVIGNHDRLDQQTLRSEQRIDTLHGAVRRAAAEADAARAAGLGADAAALDATAVGLATELVAAENEYEDLKARQAASADAAAAARQALADSEQALRAELALADQLTAQAAQAAMAERAAAGLPTEAGLAPPGATPTMDEVRAKIERRHAAALGRTELAEQAGVGRQIERDAAAEVAAARAVEREQKANDRLAAIRAGLSSPGDAIPGAPSNGLPGPLVDTDGDGIVDAVLVPPTTPDDRP